ncbi:MAG: 3-phosphoshikimate 1-carboxyvinyltransferase [Anaerolineae bacterium]|nr:3-phosphoshikimate 1-carboxyvinyltransferase [Anaerolineae bacterium]
MSVSSDQAHTWAIAPAARLGGQVRVPGDKSISHRALMLGSLAAGVTQVEGFLPSGDCMATLACLHALGVRVEMRGETSIAVHGRGLRGYTPPTAPLDCGRSGTTMRLLSGILAGQAFDTILTGDPQLVRRPMRRVTGPLREMGADIVDEEGHAPLIVRGAALHGSDLRLTVASAQVKSALLLAGLYAHGPTVVRQCGPARDHTELMLSAMGVQIEVDGLDVTLHPPGPRSLAPLSLHVPGDFSSAAFLLVAALVVAGSTLTLAGIGVNPTRTGLLDVLQRMGAYVEVRCVRRASGEPVGDLAVRAGRLHGVEVDGDTVVRMIDEFPVLAVAATQAEGETVVRDASELRVKETDRIATVVEELGKMGAQIEARPDGFCVHGPTTLRGARVHSHGDHRLGMALAVAGLIAEGQTTVEGVDCVADSFPGFDGVLRAIRQG